MQRRRKIRRKRESRFMVPVSPPPIYAHRLSDLLVRHTCRLRIYKWRCDIPSQQICYNAGWVRKGQDVKCFYPDGKGNKTDTCHSVCRGSASASVT